MSTITDKKITDGQRDAVWVQHQQDRLTGTPQQNKAVFDEYSELIREHFNDAMDVLDERISTNDSDIEQLKETDAGEAAVSARESAASASESAQTTSELLGKVISISNKRYVKDWDITDEQDEFEFTATDYTYNESDTYEVFVNGLKLESSEFSQVENVVTLNDAISGAGNTVEIIVTTNLKGKGIADTELNDDYTLTINYDDGTSMTTESIRGEKGEKGDKGDGVYDDTEVKTDISVLESRVDSFTHLTEGSTTGDAELIDARVGADGTTYPNAGDAIRGQVSAIKSSVDLVPNLGTLTWTTGKYYTYTNGEIATNNSYACILVPVNPTPSIKITTMAANPAGIVLFDSNGDFIKGVMGKSSSEMQDYEIELTQETAFIGISCVINKRDLVVISAKINDQFIELYNQTTLIPNTYIALQNATYQGIKNKDGSVYNPTTNYEGRYATGHFSAGDKIRFTGFSVNSNYPALVVKFDDNTTYYNYTNISAQYKNILYTMPKDGNVFVNGNTSVLLPVIEKLQEGLSGSYSKMLLSEYLTAGSKLKAKVDTTDRLFVKKRISSTLSVAVVFGHVGGNSLFGFSGIRLVDEVSGKPMSDSFDSNGTSINAATTDWFAPYYVQAVNNADGDVPEGNAYFTGGNHRSNNTSSGGGITAAEESIAFLFGGVTPLTDVVYNVDEIDVKWTNAVQGNNTSKADGTGRAILNENWHMLITPEKIECENDIVPLEDIKLKTYYGLQMYFPSSQVIFKGGATRTPFAISTATTSGNKTCRSALAYNSNFSIEMAVEPLDLGLFEHSNYSMFTTNVSKLYAYLVGSEITCHENEHYYVKGYYKPW